MWTTRPLWTTATQAERHEAPRRHTAGWQTAAVPQRPNSSTSAGAPLARLWTQDRRPAVVGGLLAAALAVAYLCAPLMGGDLSAQMARAEFTREHPLALIDLRWFGGSLPFGYTLWTAFLMAVAGARSGARSPRRCARPATWPKGG